MPEISVRWPFYRYDVLMPEHIPTDIFIWLYLSLFVLINQQTGKEKESYTQEEKNQVKRFIKKEFSDVIDEITLDKIILYTEKDYVLRDETGSHAGIKRILSPEAFKLINSFDTLFSSNLQIKHIYQDAITGGIVPVFEDMPWLQDNSNDEYPRLNLQVKKAPSQRKIKAAYKNYLKMLKNTADEYELEETPFVDPDAEVDFDPLNETDDLGDAAENKPTVNADNFYVQYIDSEHKRVLLNLKVDLFIENGKICVTTPFDKQKTLNWMNKRFQEASNMCPELTALLKEKQMQPQDSKEDDTIINEIEYRKNVADQLDVCGKIYRLVESVAIPNPDSHNIYQIINDLKRSLIKIDNYFTGKTDSYFGKIGLYLECLISPLNDYSDKNIRQARDKEFFKAQIRTICSKLRIKWDFLMRGEDIFREWQLARIHFKADVLNIVISNQKFLKCSSLYYEFIEEAFDLYNLRNRHGHYGANQAPLDKDFKVEYIEMLYKVTKVFLDLY